MQGKDRFLEKFSFIFLLIIFFISENLVAKNIESELLIYNNKLKNTSSLFIQTDGETVEEGIIFIGPERIKIEYKTPQKLTIVLSQKKGMYVNHALKEVQYFNTTKSIIKVFFTILTGEDLFKNSDLQISNSRILMKKKFEINNTFYKTQIIYENNPIKLRKIKILENEKKIEIGFFNYKQEETIKKDFFSLISPYPN